MNITSFYPVIQSEHVATTSAFYIEHFGFLLTFQADWYVSLKHPGPSGFELAILDTSHDTIPEGFRRAIGGLILNFEVENVDAEYDRLINQAQLPLRRALKSEGFGQRHFITCDPSGVLIDVITNIPPSADYAAKYFQSPAE
jgi:catechol 2,3-dioxygenase-like lactoylglutathione lyase family enzyme